MKKTLLTSLVSCFAVFACQNMMAQEAGIPNRGCGTMENLELMKQQDPGLESRMAALEAQTQEYLRNNPPTTQGVVITIPVVFHIVWETAAQNVTTNCINAQLAVINADFRKLNADVSKVTQTGWPALVADCEINFCLATKDPTGAAMATPGITRTQTTASPFAMSGNPVKFTANGGKDVWDRNKYLNLWVCDLSGGLLGYAQFPGQGASTDGVVIDYQYMVGSAGCGTAPYNLGRTSTHELGHFFGLYHIWGDDGTACTGSDQCSDTPNQGGENYQCWAAGTVKTGACGIGGDGSPSSTASPGYMWMNYMDYTDDACMYMFTNGQKAKVVAAMNGSTRVGLKTSAVTNCAGTGVNEVFSSDNVSIFPNPSTGEVSITMLSNINSMDLKVYNAIGEAVVTKKINVSASGETKVDLSNNPDGIYLFEVKTSEGTITKKVVINR